MPRKPATKPPRDIIITGALIGLTSLLGVVSLNSLFGDQFTRKNFLTFEPVVNESDAKVALTPVSATVSADGNTYATAIETTQKIGYRVKLSLPTYNGPVEVMFNRSASQWVEGKTKAAHQAKNGIVTITPTEMQTAPINPGIYPAKFRPFMPDTNKYAWSRQVLVWVKPTAGTIPGLSVEVSTDNKNWSKDVTTTLDQGYYLRTTAAYEGWLEAAPGKKWLQADSNGVVYVSPQIMKQGTDDFGPTKPGTFNAKFRPHLSDLNLPWSNQVTITVNDSAKMPTNLLPASTLTCSGSSKPNDGGMYINVATWNLDGNSGWEQKFGKNKDVDWRDRDQAKIERGQYKFSVAANKFSENQVDILFLQEIDPTGLWMEGLGQPLGPEVDKETNSNVFHIFKQKFPGKALYLHGAWDKAQGGAAIISKYPILEKDVRPLPGSSGRWLMSALIQLPNNKKVRVFNNHLGANSAGGTLCGNLQSQIDYQLGSQGKGDGQVKSGEPYVFGGDFNMRFLGNRFEDHMNKRGSCNPTPEVSSIWNVNCTNPGEKNATCRIAPYSKCTGQKSNGTYQCAQKDPIDFVMSGKQGGAKTYQTCAFDHFNISEHDFMISTIRL